MATADEFSTEPVPPAPKKSGSKLLLVMGTVFGLGFVVCCGGGGLAVYFLKDKFANAFSVTNDPVQVKARTQEIVRIDLPDNYTPMSAMQLSPGMFTMKMIIYQTGGNSQGGFVLMEMDQPGTDPKQMREQMLQQMRQQQSGGFNSQINAQSTETKMFTINGENIEFDFVKGTRGGDPTVFRQVLGTFPGRQGTVLLMLIVPDSEFDEAAVNKMLQSIRIPAGNAEATQVQDDLSVPEQNPEPDDKPQTDAAPENTEIGKTETDTSEPAPTEPEKTDAPGAATPASETPVEKPE